MAYIQAELQGQKTFGGYLKIDGGRQIKLYDNLIIPISAGSHYLSLSSDHAALKAIVNFNNRIGNYDTRTNTYDGGITVALEENSLLTLTVISDILGHIIGTPTTSVIEMDEEMRQRAEKLYSEQEQAAAEAYEKQKSEDMPGIKTELLLNLFLGTFGAHKFYRKKTGMGVLYLFTFGLFGVGYIVDLIKTIMKIIKYKS